MTDEPQSIRVVVPGPPVPWERTRGSNGHRYNAPRTRAYESHVRMCASAEVLRMRWPKPQSGYRYDVTMLIHFSDARRRDLTNVAKAVEDACNGVIWHDDSEITRLLLLGAIDRVRPRVEVDVLRLGKPAEPKRKGKR